MINNQLWMVFATRKFPEHILQVLDIYSCGFVLSMGMHTDFISYKVVKGARTPLPLCTSTWKHHQKMYFMTACQLSEYCLNREPELFKNTRFWHDLFHAIGHKCGICFKSGRVCGLKGINTEMCDQVNAFLQCIKYTAAHLSQEHFTFFCSFFCIFSTKRKPKLTLNKQQLLLLGKCV